MAFGPYLLHGRRGAVAAGSWAAALSAGLDPWWWSRYTIDEPAAANTCLTFFAVLHLSHSRGPYRCGTHCRPLGHGGHQWLYLFRIGSALLWRFSGIGLVDGVSASSRYSQSSLWFGSLVAALAGGVLACLGS